MTSPLQQYNDKARAFARGYDLITGTLFTGIPEYAFPRYALVLPDNAVYKRFAPVAAIQQCLNTAVSEYNILRHVDDLQLPACALMVMGSYATVTAAAGSDLDVKVLAKSQCIKLGVPWVLDDDAGNNTTTCIYFAKKTTIQRLLSEAIPCIGVAFPDTARTPSDDPADIVEPDPDAVDEKAVPSEEAQERASEKALAVMPGDRGRVLLHKLFSRALSTQALGGSFGAISELSSMKYGLIKFFCIDGTEINIHFGLNDGARHAALLAAEVQTQIVTRLQQGQTPAQACEPARDASRLRHALQEQRLDTSAQRVTSPWGATCTTAPVFCIIYLWMADRQRLLSELRRCAHGGKASFASPLFSSIDLLEDVTPVIAERLLSVVLREAPPAFEHPLAVTLAHQALVRSEAEQRRRADFKRALYTESLAFGSLLGVEVMGGHQNITLWGTLIRLQEAQAQPTPELQKARLNSASRDIASCAFFSAAASVARAARRGAEPDATSTVTDAGRGCFDIEEPADGSVVVTLRADPHWPHIKFRVALAIAKWEGPEGYEWHVDQVDVALSSVCDLVIFRRAAFQPGAHSVHEREAVLGSLDPAEYDFLPLAAQKAVDPALADSVEQRSAPLLGWLRRKVHCPNAGRIAAAVLLSILDESVLNTPAVIEPGKIWIKNNVLGALRLCAQPLALPSGTTCGRSAKDAAEAPAGWIQVRCSKPPGVDRPRKTFTVILSAVGPAPAAMAKLPGDVSASDSD
jgi:hypothetical protein